MGERKIEGNEGTGFACSCGDDGKAAMAAQLAEVKALLRGPKDPSAIRAAAIEEHLVTSMLYQLDGRYRTQVTDIAMDMWMGISTATYDSRKVGETYERVEPPVFTTWVECDTFEDGLAMTLLLYHDKFGDVRPPLEP